MFVFMIFLIHSAIKSKVLRFHPLDHWNRVQTDLICTIWLFFFVFCFPQTGWLGHIWVIPGSVEKNSFTSTFWVVRTPSHMPQLSYSFVGEPFHTIGYILGWVACWLLLGRYPLLNNYRLTSIVVHTKSESGFKIVPPWQGESLDLLAVHTWLRA